MKTLLKYGLNPHQINAFIECPGEHNPIEVLNGQPGYINILDALYGWQLVKELKASTGKASATSFKHVSPAGAATYGELTETFLQANFLENKQYSEIASAYIRARACDRMCSFGDAVAVSDTVDVDLALALKKEVSDLIIAPAYEKRALEILKTKKNGNYLILKMDKDYEPPTLEHRQVYGFTLCQDRNALQVTKSWFEPKDAEKQSIPAQIIETLITANVALKYTQSNSISVAFQGQAIGIGAGQQSRIHCTRLACTKAEKWMLQQHPKVMGLNFVDGLPKVEKIDVIDYYLQWNELSDEEKKYAYNHLKTKPDLLTSEEKQEWFSRFDGLCLASDAYIPFRDNVDRAKRSNVQYVSHTGGSLRDKEVSKAANAHHIKLIETGVRLFTH